MRMVLMLFTLYDFIQKIFAFSSFFRREFLRETFQTPKLEDMVILDVKLHGSVELDRSDQCVLRYNAFNKNNADRCHIFRARTFEKKNAELSQ